MDAQTAKDLKRSAKYVTQDECRRFIRRVTYLRINAHRCHLICKQRRTPDEQAELDQLNAEVDRLVDTAHPFTDELESLLAESVAREKAGEVWTEYTGPGR